ncbi:hypothetical protein EMIHUDRAFT_469905 [Emiliania huxleyi CCMP1516]|uniref:ABM domain-containing protein n=2 Tax=Emiliania huxleyi TaxID=2903 RepID=A0A0D3JBA3_EMIH1|nr:hypothetical protein EMIHUDRAFT_469905 [Emiliania huxleyi CCMP1516]EOD20788.1 hypothetical protein EMIHUDRAFT_469905 [Emiliania huxleyi CCMP1516]|eukprot:XP_005773217.1 hypothetical protein EMIHUDRAFT_469905 [Emiliania huxleyi CCMP1516]
MLLADTLALVLHPPPVAPRSREVAVAAVAHGSGMVGPRSYGPYDKLSYDKQSRRSSRAAVAPTMLLPWEGKSGLDVRPYDKLLNKAAPVVVPLLVGYGSKVFKPLYSLADKVRNRKADTEARQATSNAYKPCVVFSSRTIKDEAAYKSAFAEYAEGAMAGSGVRACFSFMDRDKEMTAVQFAWYDSASDLVPEPPALKECYCGTVATDYTQTWGKWNADFKAALQTDICKYSFVEEVRGFLKEPTEANAKGFATGEPPMIWISKRDILPGRMEAAGSSFQCGTDRMYTAAPAALGICEFTDPVDENATLGAARVPRLPHGHLGALPP